MLEVAMALVILAPLASFFVAGRAAEVMRTAPASIRPPVASALDLARERLDAGDITYDEFLELRRILGE